ncbi:amino acid/amide ABC transporter ATP-binding protein 2 (HAAT family) [Branchiibius hedensis]|uniref:Amino acid/amide ABC transporter ATP-binding protein 2, HAAT family n=1 Tax=Branchiibius hedensis TaxID=672460 RepID=A0A2Y8ZTZ7_9MICO|nr:ABC transporter ATP-binding protein [Branchiibius hedensis]PWJ27069.1 amino acid/amide ABC transporter ATP-binding protein 2 (HAAT family) [Branchiibius hedensis]SSA35880.1 amino acid/amide ABC transporter ATP-binding protein 2, HAAT family [Branchiibius hedensis]
MTSSTSAVGAPSLEVRTLATGYGDLQVVWDVSFAVHPGQITALVGRNGSGKTSTLRAISGLNKLTGGSVHLLGEDAGTAGVAERVHRGLAYVQEGKRVFRRLTVEQNLILGAHTRRLSRTELRDQLTGTYDLFPILQEKSGALAGSMSGGQQQMLAIGQALMAKPQVLMLDEPSGGLAPAIVAEVMARIGALADAGLGILLVEQSIDAALNIAHDVVVLDNGRVSFAGRVSESHPDQIREAVLGEYVGAIGLQRSNKAVGSVETKEQDMGGRSH